MFVVILSLTAIVAALVAALAGFGIGSILTPVMATYAPAKLAVAAVSLPHLVATAHRLWILRKEIDWQLLKTFGITSMLGGLAGASVYFFLQSRALEIVLGVLLLFVGLGGLMGWTKRLRFTGPWVWVAGAFSGFLGGLVGNQGGLRAGALVGLNVSRDAFVATSTATAILVDAARVPVYLAGQWNELTPLWPLIALTCAAVVIGTFLGMRLLRKIPEESFMRVVFVLLIALGIWLVAKPF